MPSDIPRRINSAPSRKIETGTALSSFSRSEKGTSFPESPIASIIGTVPAAQGAFNKLLSEFF
jgi:hypothetical protein